MQLSPYGGLGGLRGELMSNNPYQPKPGMAQQLGRQQMSAPDMSGHFADVQARYGLSEEETIAAVESKGQSLGGRPPVPGATSYDGTPLRPQEDPSQMIGAARPSPYELARMGPMIERAPRPPQNIGYQPIEEPNRPGFAKPLSPAPSEQGAGGGLADQEWRLKIEPVEMNMGGRIPGYQNGGDIPPPPIPEAPLFSKRRKTMGGRLSYGVPIGEFGEGYGQEQIDAGESPFPMGYLKKLGVLMQSPGTPENVAARKELNRTLNIEGDPLDNLKHMMELRKLYYEPTEDNPEGWPMPTTRRYGNGGIIGLAHGGMVPGYAHGGEVPGYFLGGLWQGIKSLGKKGLQYAPQIMGLVGDEIPGFNKLSGLGRAAVGALAKQGSRKASGQDFNLRDMLADTTQSYVIDSAKDRMRESLYGDAIPRTKEEIGTGAGAGSVWDPDSFSYVKRPGFVDPDITGFGSEKGSGSMWKDIFTDSGAAKKALEAALDIPVGETMALAFTEQERKRGQQGESTGNLGFDPMSTVGRRMPTSMSAVSGRPATSAPDIASQLTYGNMPVDYTGRAEGGMIPGYQYGGMYGEEEGGDEFGLEQYVPMTSAGFRGSVPQGQGVAGQLTYGNQPAPGEEGENEEFQDVMTSTQATAAQAEAQAQRIQDEANAAAAKNKVENPYGEIHPDVLAGKRDMTQAEIDKRAGKMEQEKRKQLQQPDPLLQDPVGADPTHGLDDGGERPEGFVDQTDLSPAEDSTKQYIESQFTGDKGHGRKGSSGGAGASLEGTRVMPGSGMSYGPSNQFSGVGSGFYGENKWFDPNAKEVAAKEISGLNPHELPRTAKDFAGTGDQAGADLLSRLGKADGGMVGSANPMLQSVSPEDMQALMMASVQLDSPNSRDIISNIMRKYSLSAMDLNQMLETLMTQAQTMQAGGKVDDVPGYGIGGALKKALKVSTFGAAQLLPEKIRDPMNKALLSGATLAASAIPGFGPAASAALRPITGAVSDKIDADRARDAATDVPQGTEVDPLTSPALQERQRYMPDPAARQASAQRGIADQMTYGDLGMQEGGLINGGGGDAMSDDIYVNAEMEANGGVQPIAVSSGEYIVPGDVVSHLGSGNTEGGADVMDQFIEDVRVQRTGTPVQPDPIDLSDVLPDTYGDRYA